MERLKQLIKRLLCRVFGHKRVKRKWCYKRKDYLYERIDIHFQQRDKCIYCWIKQNIVDITDGKEQQILLAIMGNNHLESIVLDGNMNLLPEIIR